MKVIIDKHTVIDTRNVYAVLPLREKYSLFEPTSADVYMVHRSGRTDDFAVIRVDISSAERIVDAITKEMEDEA